MKKKFFKNWKVKWKLTFKPPEDKEERKSELRINAEQAKALVKGVGFEIRFSKEW